VNAAGGPTIPVSASFDPIAGVALDLRANKVYWANSGDDAIMRADLDGSDPEIVVNTARNAQANWVAIDAVHGVMYWTTALAGVFRSNLDGTGIENIVDEDDTQ
jgi:hypothetical protein